VSRAAARRASTLGTAQPRRTEPVRSRNPGSRSWAPGHRHRRPAGVRPGTGVMARQAGRRGVRLWMRGLRGRGRGLEPRALTSRDPVGIAPATRFRESSPRRWRWFVRPG
jgi:hypothetical protein